MLEIVLVKLALNSVAFYGKYALDDLLAAAVALLGDLLAEGAVAALLDVPQLAHLVHESPESSQRVAGYDLGEHEFFLLVRLSVRAEQPGEVVAVFLRRLAPYFYGAIFPTLKGTELVIKIAWDYRIPHSCLLSKL